jgi:superfamily II DNA/RNA helicase
MEHSTAPADDTLHPALDDAGMGDSPTASETSAPDEVAPEAITVAASEPAEHPQVEGAAADAAPIEATDESEAESAWTDEPEPNGFADLGLSPEILQALLEKGYRVPTPIQAQAIPTVLMGRDVLGCAQTGTGKTASFVLPMLDILSGSRSRARMPRSLILEPTRELALQVAENFVEYGKHLRLNHALLIGGESLSDQKETLMKGVDVLIATPGRLMDLFDRGGLLLTDVNILVIDEADRMLDMGFIPDVEKIVGFLPKTRQTLFFSATMAPEIRRLADAFLSNPKEITVSRPASVATTIVAGLTVVDDLDKREALRRLIASQNVQNALIFCNRKRDVDILYKSLKRHGMSVGQLHGDMSQPERFATLARFKAGEIQLLCCSDVAARGIDIGGLSHVFNFDVPIHAEDYVHRIGRTGRAGLTGHALTLATPDDRGFVEAIEKLVGAEIPRFNVEGMDLLPFAEGDGRRRRGGGRAKPAAKAKPAVKEAVAAPEGDAAAPPARKPRRSRSKSASAEPMPLDAPQPDLPMPEPEPRQRAEPAPRHGAEPAPRHRAERSAAEPRVQSDEPRRDDSRRDRGPRMREDDGRVRAREEPRRYRRDDDLGPSVMGFGDDVPAFMLLRSRAARVAEPVGDAE